MSVVAQLPTDILASAFTHIVTVVEKKLYQPEEFDSNEFREIRKELEARDVVVFH